jgi:hypothetical protein
VPQQFVEAVSDDFVSSVLDQLQEGVIAKRNVPRCVQSAKAFGNDVQQELQLTIRLTEGAF